MQKLPEGTGATAAEGVDWRLLVLLAVTALWVLVIHRQHPFLLAVEFDGAEYIRLAWRIREAGEFKAHFWPPGFALLLAATWPIAGGPLQASHVVTGLGALAYVFFVHRTWTKLWGGRAALWGIALVLTDLTFVARTQSSTLTDMVGAALFWGGTCAALRHDQRGLAAAALLWGLAGTIRNSYVPFIVLAVGYGVWMWRARGRVYAPTIALTAFLAGSIPTFYFNLQNGQTFYENENWRSLIDFILRAELGTEHTGDRQHAYPSLGAFLLEAPLRRAWLLASNMARTIFDCVTYLFSLEVTGRRLPYRLPLVHAGVVGIALLFALRRHVTRAQLMYWLPAALVLLLLSPIYRSDRYVLPIKHVFIGPGVAALLAWQPPASSRLLRALRRAALPALLVCAALHIAVFFRVQGGEGLARCGALTAGALRAALEEIRRAIPPGEDTWFIDSTHYGAAMLLPDYQWRGYVHVDTPDALLAHMTQHGVAFAIISPADTARSAAFAPVLRGENIPGARYIHLQEHLVAVLAPAAAPPVDPSP